MNFKNPNITLGRNNMIAGAVILCILVAAIVFFSARMIAPRSGDAGGEVADSGSTPTTEQIITRADAAFKAGGDALRAGKTEEAIAQLNTAKALYEEAGDTEKMEQAVDVISHAEHEAKVEAEQPQGQGQGSANPGGPNQGGADSSVSGDTNGNGIIDDGETAPPQYVTAEGDKATVNPT